MFRTATQKNSYLERAGQPGRDGSTSAKKAQEMKPETGRVERRFAIALPVRLASLDRLWLVEPGITENVSLFGARVLLKSIWRTGERVVVDSSRGTDPRQARIIYCQALKTGGTAIGLRLERARPDWLSRSGRMGL